MEFIEKDLDFFILKMTYKYNWPFEGFKAWKIKFLNLFRRDLLFFRNYFGNNNLNDFDYDVNLKEAIASLNNNFVVATVDKAGNNFAIICKVFYKKIIMQEFLENNSYKKLTDKPISIRKRILAFDKKIKITRNSFIFPYLFVTVKFHKDPIKFRFVTCGTTSYNHKAGKLLFNLLNIILKELESNDNSRIINNNNKVLEFFNEYSEEISTVNTYDFENLFGSIPHDLIMGVFENIYNEFRNILKCEKSYWMDLIKFCIFENVLYNGVDYFLQIKGIPMGTSFSSAFANLFLYYYEKDLGDIILYRYIDDIIVINCEDFYKYVNEIYPPDLILKRTDTEGNICFLDLKIKKSNGDWLIGIYDKRQDFCFKVSNLTHWSSCIDSKVLKNILFTQINRVNRICNNRIDLKIALNNLKNSLKDNNYPNKVLNEFLE